MVWCATAGEPPSAFTESFVDNDYAGSLVNHYFGSSGHNFCWAPARLSYAPANTKIFAPISPDALVNYQETHHSDWDCIGMDRSGLT